MICLIYTQNPSTNRIKQLTSLYYIIYCLIGHYVCETTERSILCNMHQYSVGTILEYWASFYNFSTLARRIFHSLEVIKPVIS